MGHFWAAVHVGVRFKAQVHHHGDGPGVVRGCYLKSGLVDPSVMRSLPNKAVVIFYSMGDFALHAGKYGSMIHPGRLLHSLDHPLPWSMPLHEVSSSDVDSIRALYTQLAQHDPKLVDVRQFVNQLHQLEAVPSYSPLRFLGYFAILEGLLTHKPIQTDPYSSITRQIKKKVALVDHRCNPGIDYSGSGGAKVETIWETMYDYRSRLAHGETPDFGRDLKTLGNHDRALSLVKETVKIVLRQALKEPQLINDLREC